MIVYQALMSGLGAVAGVVGPAGEVVAVADDGSETRSIGESHWAYGIERYDVTSACRAARCVCIPARPRP